MKLSNTMIMNKTLMPSSKKAFTLAEVLITLSILGVVAALTIPSLVNRQNELAAITKLKKAVSSYESAVEIYMAETENADFSGLVNTGAGGAASCDTLSQYFKMTQSGVTNGACTFTTADGVVWAINNSGNAVVVDATNSPRYGVVMWARGGVVNGTQAAGINGTNIPTAAMMANPAPTGAAVGSPQPSEAQAYTNIGNVGMPVHGYFTAADMLNINTSRNQGEGNGAAQATGVRNQWSQN